MMRTLWEYNEHVKTGSGLSVSDPGIVLQHAHQPRAGIQRITCVSTNKPDNPTAKSIYTHTLEELEPVWYFIESSKVTFRVIKRCHYCDKYYKTEHEPVVGDRFLIRPKFHAGQWSPISVATVFPSYLKQHKSVVVEYRPADPDEDHITVDLNGRKLKLAVIRPPLEDEKFTHQSCILRKALNHGEEYYMKLDEFREKGGRFYYYPVTPATSHYPHEGSVKQAPGTWDFNYDLVEMKKRHNKYDVFQFSHGNRTYVGFFN